MADEKDDLEKYLDDSLNGKDRHALEKKALDDAFLSDAVEGGESIPAEDFSSDVARLKKQITVKSSRSWFTPLRIAAGIIILLGASFMIYFLGSDQPGQLASEEATSGENEMPGIGKVADTTLITMAKPDADKKTQPELSKSVAGKKAPVNTEASGAGSKTKQTEEISEGEDNPVMLAEEKDDTKADDRQTEISTAQSAPVQRSDLRKKEANSIAGVSADKSYKLDQQVVDGNVLAEDGSPLPGVNVIIKGTSQGTVTDTNGYFVLHTVDKKQPLVFYFIGMKSEEIAPGEKNHLQIMLKEDVAQLSEVVVTGQSLNDDLAENPVIKTAAPVGGIKAYNKYLENSLQYPQQALDNKIKGKVTVSFTITQSGVLSDFTIVKGLGYGCDDEVVRLVKEGPKWVPTTVNSTPVDTEVKVRVKFDPEKAKK